jgi:hypothetical protein
VGTERKRLTKSIVVAIRELMKQRSPDSNTRDYAAYIVMALQAVDETVERTVTPWEKRDYWVKADKFRMEWNWVKTQGSNLKQALIAEDWGEVAFQAAQVGSKLSDVKVSDKHRLGSPWEGAWKKFQQSLNG